MVRPCLWAVTALIVGWLSVTTQNIVARVIVLLIVLLLVLALLYRGSGAAAIQIRRTISPRIIQWGGEAFEEFTVTSQFRLPMIVDIIDHSTLPLRPTGIYGTLRCNRPIISQITVPCTQRGVKRIGPSRVIASDPFGVYERVQVTGETQACLVLPRYVEPDRLALVLPGQREGEVLGRGRGDQPPVVDGLRPYLPGDPLSRLDWQRWAARGEQYVRTFTPEVERRLWLVLDLDDLDQSAVIEALISLSASLGLYLLDQMHMPVGMLASGGWRLPAARHPGQSDELLIQLARIEPRRQDRLQTLIETHNVPWHQRDALVLLTAHPPQHWQTLLPLLHVEQVLVYALGTQAAEDWTVPVRVLPLDVVASFATDPHENASRLLAWLQGETS
jgi:uncharacterized protein (DUF58 family)